MEPSPQLKRDATRRAFTSITVLLGLLYFGHAIAAWPMYNPARYVLYLATAVVAGIFMARRGHGQGPFSVNLLLVPLGIVELSLPETTTLACVGIIVQYWFAGSPRRPRKLLVNLGIESTAAAAATFAFHSVVPGVASSIAIRLFLAGAAFFVAKTFPAAVITAMEQGTRVGRTWKERYFGSFPHFLIGASAAGFVSIRNSFLHWEACLLIAPILYVLYRAHRLQKSGIENERRHFLEMREFQLRTIETLALTVEAKDDLMGGHLNRVQIYATELGKDLGLSDLEVEALRAAALLHDIGKLAVPDSILKKPDRLTPQEFTKIKVHPVVGAEILEHAHFPYPVAPIVRAHHEKWEGSGYPDGLKGEKIPIGARILSTVDCLDALISDREYRPALSLEQAMAMIDAESGRSYDPRIVALLKRRYRELEEIVRARTSSFPKLSKNIIIENGAPAAGFIETAGREENDLVQMAENIGLPQPEPEEQCHGLLRPVQGPRPFSASLEGGRGTTGA